MRHLLRLMFVLAAILTAATSPVLASGEVVLVVSGATESHKAKIQLSWGDLEAMPERSFETTTIWTKGKHKFTGIALNDFLKAIKADGTTVKATALNDYAVEIPISDAVVDGPIIAYKMDGIRMPVREKGPLWIVYPYDEKVEYRTEKIYARSIWQLNRIEIMK
jgi:hypothetical protein